MDYAETTSSPQKLAGIAFVVLLHVAIIYALLTGLGSAVVQVLRAPLQAQIIQEVKPPELAPPPPPPPVINPPPPYIPPPLIQIAPPAAPVIATVTTQKPVAPAPKPAPAPPRPSITKEAGLDTAQTCAAPQYPEAAADMGQTGTSIVQFLIGTDGAVVQSRVAASSGHSALDDAALRALGQCKFKPAMGSDGKPQEAWTSISYVWTLN